MSYDKNGNRTSDGRFTYTWDAEDNLTAVTNKGEEKPFATYKYDEKETEFRKPSTERSRTTSTTETA
ncbi:hypothetical protein QR312_16690 [Bacillus atrophaeus]|nr:hypothetical protein [Bacillus atrophaeus]MDL5143499.1 hypothetical protein [Bacillus atrophaeus]MEC0696044.1 hypothetical protein [Bacillus atrophaeus]